MGFKWLDDEGNCLNKPAFVVKTDDDVFVEVCVAINRPPKKGCLKWAKIGKNCTMFQLQTFHLYNFVSAVYGDSPKRSLVCDVIPTGTTPRRRETLLHINKHSGEDYPEYCSGMAYLVTPDLARDFLKAATKVSLKSRDFFSVQVTSKHIKQVKTSRWSAKENNVA